MSLEGRCFTRHKMLSKRRWQCFYKMNEIKGGSVEGECESWTSLLCSTPNKNLLFFSFFIPATYRKKCVFPSEGIFNYPYQSQLIVINPQHNLWLIRFNALIIHKLRNKTIHVPKLFTVWWAVGGSAKLLHRGGEREREMWWTTRGLKKRQHDGGSDNVCERRDWWVCIRGRRG